jgi:hypothetical protein
VNGRPGLLGWKSETRLDLCNVKRVRKKNKKDEK